MKFNMNTVMQGVQMAQMFARAQDPTQQAAMAADVAGEGVKVARGGSLYRRSTVASIYRVLFYTAFTVVFHYFVVLKGGPGAIYECVPYALASFVVVSGYAWALKQSPLRTNLKGALGLTVGYSIAVASLLCALSLFSGHAFELSLMDSAWQVGGNCVAYLLVCWGADRIHDIAYSDVKI